MRLIHIFCDPRRCQNLILCINAGCSSLCKQENELILLRQQLGELCKQSHTNASHIHPEPLQSLENLTARSSPTTPAQREFAITGDRSFDGGSTKVKLDLNEAWSSSKPAPACAHPDGDTRRLSRGSPVKKDVVLVESANVTPCKGESLFSSKSFPVGDEAWANEEAKWYVNPMVETSQDFYNISTPERLNSMFSVCNPAAEGSFEWTVLRSSFANRDADLARLSLVESPPRSSQTEVRARSQSINSLCIKLLLHENQIHRSCRHSKFCEKQH